MASASTTRDPATLTDRELCIAYAHATEKLDRAWEPEKIERAWRAWDALATELDRRGIEHARAMDCGRLL